MTYAFSKLLTGTTLVAVLSAAAAAGSVAPAASAPAGASPARVSAAASAEAAVVSKPRRPRGSVSVSPRTAVPGEVVTVRGRFTKVRKRVVLLQMAAPYSWKTVATVKTDRRGRFVKQLQLPTYAPAAVPDSLAFRAKLKGKVKVKKRRYGVTTNTTRIPDAPVIATTREGDHWESLGNYFQDGTRGYEPAPGTVRWDEVRVWSPVTSYSSLSIEEFLPDGWEVGGGLNDVAWTGAGTWQDPLMVADATVRVPGVGVTPAHLERRLFVVDTSNDRLVGNILLETGEDLSAQVVGSTQGPVVAVRIGWGGSAVTRAYNVLTGAVLWEVPGELEAGTWRTVLVNRFTSVNVCAQLSVVDTTTGAVLRTFSAAGAGVDECGRVYATVDDSFSGLMRPLRYFVVQIGYAKTVTFNLDGWSGADVALSPPGAVEEWAADARSNLIVTSSPTGVSDYQTRDAVTGAAYFTTDPALDARVDSLMNGRLYLSTPDGKPVVDAGSGAVLANNTSSYPVTTVGPWTVWSSGVVSNWPYAVSP